VQHPFSAQGHPLRLRVSVGACALRHRFADAGELLNAVERTAREARTHERGVKRYEPLKPTEAIREAALVDQMDHPCLLLSEVVEPLSWAQAAEERDRARDLGVEGLMIKRKRFLTKESNKFFHRSRGS
jgi:hypothetical protein